MYPILPPKITPNAPYVTKSSMASGLIDDHGFFARICPKNQTAAKPITYISPYQ